MDNPYPWLQNVVAQVPDFLQPLIVALAGAVPYIEGEGASVFGIIAGINPIVAALAAMAGNILGVVVVVLFGRGCAAPWSTGARAPEWATACPPPRTERM